MFQWLLPVKKTSALAQHRTFECPRLPNLTPLYAETLPTTYARPCTGPSFAMRTSNTPLRCKST